MRVKRFNCGFNFANAGLFGIVPCIQVGQTRLLVLFLSQLIV